MLNFAVGRYEKDQVKKCWLFRVGGRKRHAMTRPGWIRTKSMRKQRWNTPTLEPQESLLEDRPPSMILTWQAFASSLTFQHGAVRRKNGSSVYNVHKERLEQCTSSTQSSGGCEIFGPLGHQSLTYAVIRCWWWLHLCPGWIVLPKCLVCSIVIFTRWILQEAWKLLFTTLQVISVMVVPWS